jgi:hypothetical protein
VRSVIVHFPDGRREFRYPEHDLEEDDVIAHAGDRYRVSAVDDDGRSYSVRVELDAETWPDPSTETVELLPVSEDGGPAPLLLKRLDGSRSNT